MESSVWDGPALRVGHLISSEFAGGPEKQIVALGRQLVERGWSVVIGSFLEGRDDVEILERSREAELDTFAIATRHAFDPSALLQLHRQLRDHRLDVLVTHGYKGNVLGRMVTSVSPTQHIAMVRGFTFANWKVRRYEELDRFALRLAPRVLCVSEGTRKILEGHGMRGPRYRVLHNAVDCRVRPAPIDLAKEYALPPDARILVAAGRLSPEKGHHVLVEAMAAVVEREPRARCLIFGEGPLRNDLDTQVSALGLRQQVRLVGFRREILGCLAGADLVVNPSFSEGLPNVILEAMSQSTACVATKVGGVEELLEDGHSGWLVGPDDVRAMADAIVEALADDARRAEVAATARAVAEERFSFETQAERFAIYCRELVPTSGGSRQ